MEEVAMVLLPKFNVFAIGIRETFELELVLRCAETRDNRCLAAKVVGIEVVAVVIARRDGGPKALRSSVIYIFLS